MSCWKLLLLCLALWHTSPTVTAQSHVLKMSEGADLWVWCRSDKNLTLPRRIFCKNDCEEEDVLVQTSGSDQTNGRYRIHYWNLGSPPQDYIRVTIYNLSLSDSGRYRSFWDGPEQSEYREFMVEVTDGAEAGPNTVFLFTEGEDSILPFYFPKPGKKKTFCRNASSEEDVFLTTTGDEAQSGRYRIQYQKLGEDKSVVTVMIRDLNMADSGNYQCRLDRLSKKFGISVATAPPTGVTVTQPPSETTTEQEPTTRPALWHTSPTAQSHVLKMSVGADLWVWCRSDKNLTLPRRIFCKNDCEEEDVLVQTSGSDQTNGRYRIHYWNLGSPPQDYIRVTIYNLSLSDSGRYRSFWDGPEQSEYREFMVEVTDVAEAGPNTVFLFTEGEDAILPFYFPKPGKKKTFCRNASSEEDVFLTTTGDEAQSGRYRIQYQKLGEDKSVVTVMIRDLNMADSGNYQCRLDGLSKKFGISVATVPPTGVTVTQPPSETTTEQKPTARPGESSKTQTLVLVPVCGLIIIIVTATVLTIYCRRHSGRRSDGGGAQTPERDVLIMHPQNEDIHQDLCLQQMEPVCEQLNQG